MFIAQTPIITVARMTKFNRARLLARSLKLQRELLATARQALRNGGNAWARSLLATWTRERQAYRLALSWQAL